MKKTIQLLMTAVLGATVLSCTAEQELTHGKTDADNVASGITFVFKGLNGGPITYAESPIATEKEYEVKEIDAYMFEYTEDGEDGKFLAKFANDQLSIANLGTEITLKLPILSEYGSDDKTFYFVANPSATTSIAVDGDVTEKEFRQLISNAQTFDTNNRATNLATPLLFTGKTTGPVDPTGYVTTNNTVTMKRRVARFDIVNNYPNFYIKGIYVSNANIQGYIFGNAEIPGAGLGSVMSSGPLAYTNTIYKEYETIGTDRMLRSVFYTYPGKIADGEMELAIIASVNTNATDQNQMFYVTPPAGGIDINANYRYKLVVSEDITFGIMSLKLELADWDDDDVEADIDAKKAMELTDFAVNAGDPDFAETPDASFWDEPSLTYDLSGTDANDDPYVNFTFTVKNAREIDPVLKQVRGTAAGVTAPKVTKTLYMTYGIEVGYYMTVQLPVLEQPKDIAYELTVTNKANFSETATIRFEYPMEDAWARSNIVWDATNNKLTFAVTETDLATIPANSKGAFFKQNSLLAYNPTLVFNPTANSYTWATAPYYGNRPAKQDNSFDSTAAYNGGTGFKADEGLGDICRYITAQGWVEGKWRTPTIQEWIDLYEKNGKVWVTGATGTIKLGCLLGEDNAADGNSLSAPKGRTVAVPASGTKRSQDANGTYNHNVWCYYASSTTLTADSSYLGYVMYFSPGSANPAMSPTTSGRPVRCVRE